MSDKQLQEKKNWGISYGELVQREFVKNRLNIISLFFIVFLFAVAVFAPILANDKPYVIRVYGELSFPLFRSLNAIDYCVFLAALIAVVQIFLIRRNRRNIEPFSRSSVLSRQVFISIAVFLVGLVLFFSLIPKRLDATDYKAMVASGRAEQAVFAPVPYGFARTDLRSRELPPSRQHWLGTDDVGADVLCRLIHGSRISLSVGFVAVGISSVIGIIVGAILGYFGGKVDFVGMRIV